MFIFHFGVKEGQHFVSEVVCTNSDDEDNDEEEALIKKDDDKLYENVQQKTTKDWFRTVTFYQVLKIRDGSKCDTEHFGGTKNLPNV